METHTASLEAADIIELTGGLPPPDARAMSEEHAHQLWVAWTEHALRRFGLAVDSANSRMMAVTVCILGAALDEDPEYARLEEMRTRCFRLVMEAAMQRMLNIGVIVAMAGAPTVRWFERHAAHAQTMQRPMQTTWSNIEVESWGQLERSIVSDVDDKQQQLYKVGLLRGAEVATVASAADNPSLCASLLRNRFGPHLASKIAAADAAFDETMDEVTALLERRRQRRSSVSDSDVWLTPSISTPRDHPAPTTTHTTALPPAPTIHAPIQLHLLPTGAPGMAAGVFQPPTHPWSHPAGLAPPTLALPVHAWAGQPTYRVPAAGVPGPLTARVATTPSVNASGPPVVHHYAVQQSVASSVRVVANAGGLGVTGGMPVPFSVVHAGVTVLNPHVRLPSHPSARH